MAGWELCRCVVVEEEDARELPRGGEVSEVDGRAAPAGHGESEREERPREDVVHGGGSHGGLAEGHSEEAELLEDAGEHGESGHRERRAEEHAQREVWGLAGRRDGEVEEWHDTGGGEQREQEQEQRTG